MSIAGIVPPSVVVEEVFGDLPDVTLFPAEQAVIAAAVGKRRQEFTTARGLARAALARIGIPPAPILPGLRGAPQWPDGVVGSITHCDGYRAAAVARSRDVLTVGIDAEPDTPVPGDVLSLVALDAERAMVRDLTAAHPGPCWDKLLFSAKEAVYKAWFPLTRAWLDFGEAHITVDPDRGTFHAALLVPGPVPGFTGRWRAARGLVLTAIAVPAR